MGFCCVDFATSTKTYLEVKIGLAASLWRDSFSGPKRKRRIMHSMCERTLRLSVRNDNVGNVKNIFLPIFKISYLLVKEYNIENKVTDSLLFVRSSSILLSFKTF